MEVDTHACRHKQKQQKQNKNKNNIYISDCAKLVNIEKYLFVNFIFREIWKGPPLWFERWNWAIGVLNLNTVLSRYSILSEAYNHDSRLERRNRKRKQNFCQDQSWTIQTLESTDIQP
jgi:hypothetical protein